MKLNIKKYFFMCRFICIYILAIIGQQQLVCSMASVHLCSGTISGPIQFFGLSFFYFFLVFLASGGSGSGGVAATSAGVEQDVLDKLREFDIEEAAGPLAQQGFKKMRTLQKMEDRFPKDILCYLLLQR